MSVFTVDVWHSTTFPIQPDQDWRRYVVSAETATEAELIACQIAASHSVWDPETGEIIGWTPTRSAVIEWEQ